MAGDKDVNKVAFKEIRMARAGKKRSFNYHVTKFLEYINKSDYLSAESELNHVRIALGNLRTLTDNLIILFVDGDNALANAELDDLKAHSQKLRSFSRKGVLQMLRYRHRPVWRQVDDKILRLKSLFESQNYCARTLTSLDSWPGWKPGITMQH